MLVDPDERAVDEDVFKIRIVAEGLENALPPFCAQRQKRVKSAALARSSNDARAHRSKRLLATSMRMRATMPVH
jgi:hypothetical protein